MNGFVVQLQTRGGDGGVIVEVVEVDDFGWEAAFEVERLEVDLLTDRAT